MNQGKYAAPVKRRRRRRNPLKPLLVAMAVVLLIGCAVGGTLAWLTSEPDPVVNTFTVGDIEITLTETWNTDTDGDKKDDSWQGKMIPGWTIFKDPVVTVKAGSEPCYLFIKVTESTDPVLSNYIEYAVDKGIWTELAGVDNVWYKAITTETASDTPYAILGAGTFTDTDGVEYTWSANQVLVKPTVTKTMMNSLGPNYLPKLTFQAAAVQYYKTNGIPFEVADAYALAFSAT